MSAYSRWLDDVQDEEAGGAYEEDELLAYLPSWAAGAVSALDSSLDRTEDYLSAAQEKWTPPWLSHESVKQSARAAGDAGRRFRLFVCLLLASMGLFLLAFVIGLPVLALRPQKFALAFTLGSLVFMGSFAALRGLRAHLATLCAPARLPWCFAYATTMAATLWAACVRRSYLYTMATAGAQLFCLVYYLGTYVPGGGRGVRLFLRAALRTAGLVLRPVCACCGRCFASYLKGG
mmetsp:Transcript_11022/g.32889  ORF Transcript_11022/g.32889 Transcript_11022/m.32889 type:complete len:234 (+) Transcript_11022:238-939(+)